MTDTSTTTTAVPTPPTDVLRERGTSRLAEPRHTSRRVDDHTWELDVVLPGVKREDISISLKAGELEVLAPRTDALPAGWRPLQSPRPRPDGYRLQVSFAVEVDSDRIGAKLEDGVLTLRLPVAENAKPRRITVE